jgi:hypothetical protein
MPWQKGKPRLLVEVPCKFCEVNTAYFMLSASIRTRRRNEEGRILGSAAHVAICESCATKVAEHADVISERIGSYLSDLATIAVRKVQAKLET